MTEAHCQPGATRDPGGTPFADLDPAILRRSRTSIKWTRYPDDVLPMFVAEMDFPVAQVVQDTLIERIQASDTGYLDAPGPLAAAVAEFADDRWGWQIPTDQVHLATDVATGIVESIRLFLPDGGRIIVPTPAYPSFFEMLEEVPCDIVEVPVISVAGELQLDLETIAELSSAEPGIAAILLCNPQNPQGLVHSRETLTALAEIAAAHQVFVISDEIHAPLTFPGAEFVPFAPIAAAAGAVSVTATSASKGWNLAGTKCSVIVAADERSNEVLRTLPPEVACRTSILGLHASVTAFTHARDWLDRAIAQFVSNDQLLADLLAEHLPGVRYTRPQSGYLAWLDFSDAGLGPDPHARILHDAKVALGNGEFFGAGGHGHVRMNLACAPDTIRAAIDRIAAILPAPAK